MIYEPNEHGYWGEYGGRFVPETLVAPLDELIKSHDQPRDDALRHELILVAKMQIVFWQPRIFRPDARQQLRRDIFFLAAAFEAITQLEIIF